MRASLAAGLFSSARVFRDAEESWADTPLWVAIRTLGGLVKAEQAVTLLEFLRVDDWLQTRQVALQALQAIPRDDTAARELPDAVKGRVRDLAVTYLNPDFLVSGENIALAANACSP